MDIKWKNNRLIVWSSVFTFGLIGLMVFFQSWDYFAHKNYYETDDFQNQLENFYGYVSVYDLYDLSLEEVKPYIEVSDDEIEEYRYRFGTLPEQLASIKQQYEYDIETALAEDNKELADYYKAERDDKLEDITKNFQDDSYVREKIKTEKLAAFSNYTEQKVSSKQNYPTARDSFVYYFKNNTTDQVYTNVSFIEGETVEDVFTRENLHYQKDVSISSTYLSYYGLELTPEIENALQTAVPGTFEGVVGVPKGLPVDNSIQESYSSYRTMQVGFWIFSGASILALFFSIVFMLKIRIISTRKPGILSQFVASWPLDMRIILILLAFYFGAMTSYIIAQEIARFVLYHHSIYLPDLIVCTPITIFLWILVVQEFYNLKSDIQTVDQLKATLQESFLVRIGRKLINNIQLLLLDRSLGFISLFSIFVLLLMGAGWVSLFSGAVFMLIYLFCCVVIGFPVIVFLLLNVGSVNQIVDHTNRMIAGNETTLLHVKGHRSLKKLASNLNYIQKGYKQSISAQLKSERLKTELITNVSHDLRTPLTSIITYTELLKTDGLDEGKRAEYLGIIDRKSQRLKSLLDDLFDVSKMASGNVELKKQPLDLVELLHQTLGEYSELIENAQLQLVPTIPNHSVIADVDGQKIWRVFDNIIGNACKYSLDHTRIYVHLQEADQQVKVTVKNISKYPLNDSSEELLERFKRGDTARQTEGSGLGLAIAKSIVDLHEGKLSIETDGDLFKVVITLLK